jgi:type II secretory pathway component GspD/PulD (secretin)
MRSFVLYVAAVLAFATVARADDPPKPRLATKVFPVAELIVPIPDLVLPAPWEVPGPAEPAKRPTTAENAEKLLRVVTSMVRPYSWDAMGGPGKAEFYEIGSALVVTNTEDVLREVGDLLEAYRRLQSVSVVTEVRVLTVPAGFCERVGIKRDGNPGLTEEQVRGLLEAAEGQRDASVQQFPKVTTFVGQTATVRCGERRFFVTGVEATRVKGEAVMVAKNTPVELGDTLTLRGRVSADHRFVSLQAKVTRTRVEGESKLLPVVTQITPVFEGGSRGQPVPFTQYVEAPEIKTVAAERDVTIPTGGTVLLGVWTEPAKGCPPVLSMIPYMQRLFRNAGPAAECEVIVLATARVLEGDAPEVAPMPRPTTTRPRAFPLRNAAAADVAQALTEFLKSKKLDARLTHSAPSNTVYVQASAAVLEQVTKLIEKMDATPQQVQIALLVAQVPADFLSDIGMTDDTPNSPVLPLTARELNMLSVQIRKAKTRGCLKILAEPQFAAFDNQPAYFLTGGGMPFGGTPTIGPESVVMQAIQHQRLGVAMRVTPRINPDGTILMRVEPQVSSLSPTPVDLGNGTVAPAFNVQSLVATMRAADGQAVLVHGLTGPLCKANPDDGPFTALAKQACGSRRSELLFILTPHVVRSEVDQARVLAEEARRMEGCLPAPVKPATFTVPAPRP